MADGILPVRERILEFIKGEFLQKANGVNGYVQTWNTVQRRPLTDEEIALGSALGIFDTTEDNADEIQYQRKTMNVIIEFWLRTQIGEGPSSALNLALADITRTMLADLNMGALTIDVRETRSELDIDGPGDNIVGGIAVFDIVYRHQVGDPRKLMGET